MYGQPFVFRFQICGFNQWQIKNILRKFQKVSKKQNFNLQHAGNYLHSIYIVFGIISNLEMIQSIQEDMHRLYENTTPFYIVNSSIFGFWYPQGPWNPFPTHPEGQLYLLMLLSPCYLSYWEKYVHVLLSDYGFVCISF